MHGSGYNFVRQRYATAVPGGPGTSDPGQITFRNVSLMGLLMQAYPGVYHVYGPGWLDQARFDVIAKMPADTTKEQAAIMMRNLVAERCAHDCKSTTDVPVGAGNRR